MGDEAIHGVQPDVVGIHVIRARPAQLTDGRIGGGAHARGLGADDEVSAVGFVPHRHDAGAALRGHLTGAKLRFGLMREAVPNAQREFL